MDLRVRSASNLRQHLKAVYLRHVQVQEDQVWYGSAVVVAPSMQKVQRLIPVVGDVQAVPCRPLSQNLFQQTNVRRTVVNNEDLIDAIRQTQVYAPRLWRWGLGFTLMTAISVRV